MPDPLIDLARFEGGIRQQGAQSLSQAVGSAPALALDAYNRMQDQQMKRVAFAAQMTADRLKNEALTRNMENADRELRLRMEAHQERLASMQLERALHEEQLRRTKEEPDYYTKQAIEYGLKYWSEGKRDDQQNVVSVTKPNPKDLRGNWIESSSPEDLRAYREQEAARSRGSSQGTQKPPVGDFIYSGRDAEGEFATLYSPNGTSQISRDPLIVRRAKEAAMGYSSESRPNYIQMVNAYLGFQEKFKELEQKKADASSTATTGAFKTVWTPADQEQWEFAKSNLDQIKRMIDRSRQSGEGR